MLGDVVNGQVVLNDLGAIVEEQLNGLSVHFATVSLDCWVIMPNHIHYVVLIDASQISSNRPSLGQTVGYFKYQSTKQINNMRDTPGVKLWQRNYYEHIVRNDESLERLRTYIANNPRQWQIDQLHPNVPSKW